MRYFLWWGFYIASLSYDNGMDHAIGAGIPAPSDAIDVCFSQHQSALWEGIGIPAPPQGQRPEDLGHRADEQKPLFA